MAKQTEFIYPSLHVDVAAAVSEQIGLSWFHEEGEESDCDNDYSTYVMAKFTCTNKKCCASGWFSGKVAIQILGYPGNGYKAIVFNQRCKKCHRLGNLALDERSYIDRVAYRLKKWAGIRMEQTIYERKESRPHRRDLCEGCKKNICEQTEGTGHR